MDQVKTQIEKLLLELETLPENRKETAMVVANPRPSYMQRQQTVLLPSVMLNGPKKNLLKESKDHQNQLSKLLQQTYSLLKKYGEAADIAELRDAGFQMILGDYPIEDVTKAFMTYLKTNKEVPTPSDIVAIIEPSTKLCPFMYQKLCRQKGLTGKERDYIDYYEEQQLQKLKHLPDYY